MHRILTRKILLSLCLLATFAAPSRGSSVYLDMQVTTPGPPQQTKLLHQHKYLYNNDEIRKRITTDDNGASVDVTVREDFDDYAHRASFYLYAVIAEGASFDVAFNIMPPGQACLWELRFSGPYQQANWGVEWKGVSYGANTPHSLTGLWEGYPYYLPLHIWGEQRGTYSAYLSFLVVPTPAAWTSGALLLAGLALANTRKLLRAALTRRATSAQDDQHPI